MDDMFFAFTVVQHVMTELSRAATEKEKVTIITKVMFRLLMNKVNNNGNVEYAVAGQRFGKDVLIATNKHRKHNNRRTVRRRFIVGPHEVQSGILLVEL
jgi:hypothetical protein